MDFYQQLAARYVELATPFIETYVNSLTRRFTYSPIAQYTKNIVEPHMERDVPPIIDPVPDYFCAVKDKPIRGKLTAKDRLGNVCDKWGCYSGTEYGEFKIDTNTGEWEYTATEVNRHGHGVIVYTEDRFGKLGFCTLTFVNYVHLPFIMNVYHFCNCPTYRSVKIHQSVMYNYGESFAKQTIIHPPKYGRIIRLDQSEPLVIYRPDHQYKGYSDSFSIRIDDTSGSHITYTNRVHIGGYC